MSVSRTYDSIFLPKLFLLQHLFTISDIIFQPRKHEAHEFIKWAVTWPCFRDWELQEHTHTHIFLVVYKNKCPQNLWDWYSKCIHYHFCVYVCLYMCVCVCVLVCICALQPVNHKQIWIGEHVSGKCSDRNMSRHGEDVTELTLYANNMNVQTVQSSDEIHTQTLTHTQNQIGLFSCSSQLSGPLITYIKQITTWETTLMREFARTQTHVHRNAHNHSRVWGPERRMV